MGIDLTALTRIAGWLIYVSLAGIALWGAYCVVVAWRRVAQTRFRTEAAQDDFLDQLTQLIHQGDLESAESMCEGDRRAMPQLALLALASRELGLRRIRQLLSDRFYRDVLSDLEYRLSWVQTVVRSAPMVGLLGTVVGMMGAFSKLQRGDELDPANLAGDISLALITTACGLAIAIPLVLCTATINVRIRQLEDLVGHGLTRLMDVLTRVWGNDANKGR